MSSEPNQPSEEELRAAYEAEIKRLRVEHILLDNVAALANLGMRRTGLAPGTESERDPAQVRLAIESIRALLPVVEQAAPSQVGAIRDAVSQLQIAFVRIGGDGGSGRRGSRRRRAAGRRRVGPEPSAERDAPPPPDPGASRRRIRVRNRRRIRVRNRRRTRVRHHRRGRSLPRRRSHHPPSPASPAPPSAVAGSGCRASSQRPDPRGRRGAVRSPDAAVPGGTGLGRNSHYFPVSSRPTVRGAGAICPTVRSGPAAHLTSFRRSAR